MIAAVIDIQTNTVLNKIVADAEKDLPHDGTYLVNVPDGVMFEMGWIWDGKNFTDPNPTTEVVS